MQFDELQIPPPRYWQQFEDLCLSIFREVWSDPTAQKNGRSGQPQHGTDISGTVGGTFVGVQCKGKDAGLGATLTEQELLDEVEKAKGFNPPLVTWTLATSAPKDARVEELARQITATHQATGLFAVRVLGWEDLLSLMGQYPSVIEHHYPDLARRSLEGPTPDLTEAIRLSKDAATRDIEKFQNAEGGAKSLRLSLEKEAKEGPLPFRHADAAAELRSGQPLLLEAEPGAGKSTTLIQLAASVLTESDDCTAVLVLLPEMGQMRRDLISEIASKDAFRGISIDTLCRIAQTGRLVVLCDGWNELSAEQRDWVRTALVRFRREYPDSGLLVATRALSPPPIHAPVRLFLRPPSRAQQLAILTETLGPAAEELLNRARRTPGLGDLLRTPLYVAVLAEIGSSGALPATKEQAIRRFIERQEQRPEHSTALRNQVQDRHQDYLRAAAYRLTVGGAGAISQSDLRTEVAQVSELLRTAGQITSLPEQQAVIDVLVSHHVLVERPGETGKSFYSFQHQQFQEWFASFHVEERIAAAASPSPENAQFLGVILDQPDWEEAIFFAVERLSRSTPEGARFVGHAITRAIAIDPMLGAAMIRRASPETWAHIAEPVVDFGTKWYQTAEQHRAFRFMVGTGRPEFAAPVWETINSKDGYDRSANFDFGWFALSVLGPDAFGEYAKLPDDRRRSLLWDLLRFGGQEGIDFALKACRSEPSAEVVRTVLDTLWFGGATSEFYALIQTVSPDVWKLLATRHSLTDASGEFRTRLLEAKKELAAAASGGDKFRILLELTNQGEYDNPGELIGLAFEVKPGDYQQEYTIFTPLASKYPEQLSQLIVKRLLRGDALPVFADRLVGVAAAEYQDSLRAIALGSISPDRRVKEVAARALNLESAQSLIQDLFAVLDEVAGAAGPAANSLRQKYQAITEALHLLHRTIFVSSILATDAITPRHIAALAELVFRWRSDDRDNESLPIDETIREELSRALDQWVQRVIGNPETNRSDLSNLVTAIKRVGVPSLLPALKRLLDADIAGWHREQTERERLRKEGRPTTMANVGYSPIYRQAIEAFQGDAVRDLLLTYIGNPDFEVEAAFALRQYGTSDRIPSPAEGFGRPKYEEVLPARQRRALEQRPVSAVAVALLDRIDTLLQTGLLQDLGRAIGLATAVAQMDYGDRVATITAVLAAPGPISSRYGLLLVLPFAGEIISATNAQQGYDEALASYLAQKWHSRNEWWVIDRWIELMAFSDAPESIIDCVEKLPPEFKNVHNFDRIVYALGYIDPAQSLKVLTALAGLIPELSSTHYYINACAQLGSLEATRHLLAVAHSPPAGAPHHHDLLGLSNVLPILLGKHPDIRQELLTRLAADRELAASPVIARALPSILGQQDVLMLLQAWAPHGADHASRILEQAVHDLVVKDRPIEGSNAFEREPFDLSALRSELFRIYVKEEPQAAFAAKLLRIIDSQRDVYGRPISEPRHPNLALGVSWPNEAASIIFRETEGGKDANA